MSSAWLVLTYEYAGGERPGRPRDDWPVTIDGVVSEGELARRARTGWRKRWLVAPGPHTLRVGHGWRISPSVPFAVEEGQTARFRCQRRPDPADGGYIGLWYLVYAFRLLAHLFKSDLWFVVEPVSRSPGLQDF